jgi:two-component system response regulator DevR
MAKTGTVDRRVSVAVVDDDEDTLLLLRDILQSGKAFTFAGGFSSGTEALAAIPRLRPNLALVDIRLPDMDGIECAKLLSSFTPGLTVIIISGNRDIGSFDRSRAAGAAAYLVKPFDPAQLIAALRLSLPPAKSAIQPPSVKSKADGRLALTVREKAVLAKLAEGLQYKEIAEALGITYSAVHKRQRRIFKKLHVSKGTEATRIWLQQGGGF